MYYCLLCQKKLWLQNAHKNCMIWSSSYQFQHVGRSNSLLSWQLLCLVDASYTCKHKAGGFCNITSDPSEYDIKFWNLMWSFTHRKLLTWLFSWGFQWLDQLPTLAMKGLADALIALRIWDRWLSLHDSSQDVWLHVKNTLIKFFVAIQHLTVQNCFWVFQFKSSILNCQSYVFVVTLSKVCLIFNTIVNTTVGFPCRPECFTPVAQLTNG